MTLETISQLAHITHKKLNPKYWSMRCVKNEWEIDTQLEYTFVLIEDCWSIVCDRQIQTIKAFAELTGAFAWYITKDLGTEELCFRVEISIEK